MDSNTHQIYDQNSQPHSGLLRLRSAPSSLIASFTGNGVLDKTGGFEPDRLQISRFMSSDADLESPNARDFAVTPQHQNQSYASLPPHYPRPNGAVSSSAMDDVSYQFLSTKPLNSNLARQSSSPAGMFTNLHVQHGGYGSMKNMMSYESSTRPPSSLGMVSQISEIGNANSAFGSQYDHWNDQSSLMENLPGVKMESQNGEGGNHVQLLSHHLSLPKTSSEMAAMEKIFQMNDSVPFKIRAKRGCATHPRSIAERVRRTKISERMRKLQELVPNMDKQMNTADMLDLAVEYIKALQGQFKMLSDNQANCKCKNTEKKPIQNQMV